MKLSANKKDTLIGIHEDKIIRNKFHKKKMKKYYVFPDSISFIDDNKSPNMISSNDNFPFIVDWQMFEFVIEQLSDASSVEM